MSPLASKVLFDLEAEDRDFDVVIMPQEGKSARNCGGVRLLPNKDWPSASLARLGCQRVVFRFRSTPAIEEWRAASWRASSLIYRQLHHLVADLAQFGVDASTIEACRRIAAPYFGVAAEGRAA